MAQTGSNKKVANSLVALSSAAVLAVDAAGYSRTRSAASRLAAQAVERRPVVPQPLPETPPAALVTPAEPVQPSAPVPVRTAAPSPIEPPAGAVDAPDEPAAPLPESGHILSATIAQCLTRYSGSVIDKLPPEVAQRQSPEVDYVSGATQSANAFYYAVVDALGKAR